MASEDGSTRTRATAGDLPRPEERSEVPVSSEDYADVERLADRREVATYGARQILYDSRRSVHYLKPLWRGWLHLAWFEASIIIGTLLIAGQHGALRITAPSTQGHSPTLNSGEVNRRRRGDSNDPLARNFA